MKDNVIVIGLDGTITHIFSDSLQVLANEGTQKIRRASHVEPGEDNLWYADMAPVKGPVLGPYSTRKQALAEEVIWLENNFLLGVPV